MIAAEDYRDEVKRYVSAMNDELVQNFGTYRETWDISIKLIADNYQMYLDCLDQIRHDGIMMIDDHGRLQRHPLIPTLTSLESYIHKLCNSFGLNLMAASKIKTLDNAGDDFDKFTEE